MLAVIGGTGIYDIVERGDEVEKKVIKTPYGESPEVSIFQLHQKEVAFMPRHSKEHAKPPHMINYRANIWALKKLGVEKVIATNAVGSLFESMKPGDFIIPHDFIDFTRMRKGTFYDDKTVHIDVTEPYCPEVRDVLKSSGDVVGEGIYVCTEGPRFETKAEVDMFQSLGGTVVGMTGLPEAVLARELEMCYASVCIVSNFAASISPNKLTIDEVFEILERKKEDLIKLIYNSILKIPSKSSCPCMNTLDGAEVEDSWGGEDL